MLEDVGDENHILAFESNFVMSMTSMFKYVSV